MKKRIFKRNIIILMIISVMLAMAAVINAGAESFPQNYGKEENTLGAKGEVTLSANAAVLSPGGEITFTVGAQLDKAFEALYVMPVYDVDIFTLYAENDSVVPGIMGSLAADKPSLMSQKYTGESLGGTAINAYDCVYLWTEPKTISGDFFQFRLCVDKNYKGAGTTVKVYVIFMSGTEKYAVIRELRLEPATETGTEIVTATPGESTAESATEVISNTPARDTASGSASAATPAGTTPTGPAQSTSGAETAGKSTAEATAAAGVSAVPQITAEPEVPAEEETETPSEDPKSDKKKGCGGIISGFGALILACASVMVKKKTKKTK